MIPAPRVGYSAIDVTIPERPLHHRVGDKLPGHSSPTESFAVSD